MVIQQKEKAELKKKMADGLAETPFDRASNMSTRSRTKVKSSFAFSAADNQKPGEMIRQGWDNNSKTRYLYYSSKIQFFPTGLAKSSSSAIFSHHRVFNHTSAAFYNHLIFECFRWP